MNYEKDIRIRPDVLDIEWLEQPSLLLKYASKVAEAQRKLDHASERVKVVKADLVREAGENPEAVGLKAKPTVQAIESYCITNGDYQTARDAQTEAQYELSLLQAAVTSIHHRKAALENLVRLYGMQYFAGPTTPRDLNEEYREIFSDSAIRSRRSDDKVDKTMKRRRSKNKGRRGKKS